MAFPTSVVWREVIHSVLVFWVLVALQNWLQHYQKVTSAWYSQHPKDVYLIYCPNIAILPLIVCASVECAVVWVC